MQINISSYKSKEIELLSLEDMRKDIRNIPQEELEQFFSDNNIQKFRIKQLNEWLWKKGGSSFDQMSSL